MKLAYILGEFPSFTEYFILNEIIELDSRGFEIEILALSDYKLSSFQKEIRQVIYNSSCLSISKVIAHIYGALIFRSEYFRALCITFKCSRFALIPLARALKAFSVSIFYLFKLRNRNIAHIHAHFANLPASIAFLMSSISGIPFSFTAHAQDIFTSDKKELIRKSVKAKFVVTCTAYNKRYLDEILTDYNLNVHHIYHGLDLNHWEVCDLGIKTASIKILSVARLVEKKGLNYLVGAVDILKKNGYHVQCSIIGDGPHKKKLEEQIQELELKKEILMWGPVPQEKLRAFYCEADFFVLPCLISDNGDRDGLPNVLLESLAQGLPVISTNVSAVTELIIHLQTGYIVPERDSESIVQGICKLKYDTYLYNTIREQGRRKVENEFSIKSSTESLISLFYLK